MSCNLGMPYPVSDIDHRMLFLHYLAKIDHVQINTLCFFVVFRLILWILSS